jgi:hypothetical protein
LKDLESPLRRTLLQQEGKHPGHGADLSRQNVGVREQPDIRGLDPSYAAIAAKAGVCVRTVASALKRLRELGILNWVRRCAESWQDGRFVLEQETNAYAVLPESQWRGYRSPPEPPAAPWPDTWGAIPPLPSVLAQAALAGDLAGKVQALASDPKDGLAAALARLGQAFLARNA